MPAILVTLLVLYRRRFQARGTKRDKFWLQCSRQDPRSPAPSRRLGSRRLEEAALDLFVGDDITAIGSGFALSYLLEDIDLVEDVIPGGLAREPLGQLEELFLCGLRAWHSSPLLTMIGVHEERVNHAKIFLSSFQSSV